MRMITLPNGNRVTVAAYVKAWRLLKTLPPDQAIWGWQWFPVTVREALLDISKGVQDRINEAIPRVLRGME